MFASAERKITRENIQETQLREDVKEVRFFSRGFPGKIALWLGLYITGL